MADAPITPIHLKLLGVNLMHRGTDATGIALQKPDGSVLVHKDNRPAWSFFVDQRATKDFLEEHLGPENDITAAILHTRAWTKGVPTKNANNHPMYADLAAIVHNGHIHNDDELFRQLELDRRAETDSDIIRAIIDKHGLTPKCIRELGKMQGGAAVAALDPRHPGEVLLFRSEYPLVVGHTDEFLAWASEQGALYRALRPLISRWNIKGFVNRPDIAWHTMPDNTAYLIGPKGLRWHQELKLNHFVWNGHQAGRDYRAHETYRAKQLRTAEKKDDKPDTPRTLTAKEPVYDYVLCPNGKCSARIRLKEEHQKLKLEQLKCKACNTNLAGALRQEVSS